MDRVNQSYSRPRIPTTILKPNLKLVDMLITFTRAPTDAHDQNFSLVFTCTKNR